MRSVPGYLARLAAAGRPGGTAALRPPRSLFAPGGGPALAGPGDEARPPRPPAESSPRSGGATTAARHDEPAGSGASEPRLTPGPVSRPADRHRRPADGASPLDVGPVILPRPARRAGPPPRPDRAQPRPAAGQTSAATAERASRPGPGPGSGPGEQPGRPTSATPAVAASPGRQAAAPPAPAGFAAQLSRWAPGHGKSARDDGPVAAQPPGPGRSAGPAQGSAQGPPNGRPHRASAPTARPDPIAELVPSPGPRSAPDGTSRAPASGLLAGPVPHGGGPARVTIGTIEVTVVPPPPPPATSGPTWAPGRQRPSADAARRGARRCFGTGQI